jgi:hemerythrin
MDNADECRCYVEHLLAEHRRLHGLLRSVRTTIVESRGPDGDVSSADIVRALRQLREELKHHFIEEEAGGCLDEAVSRCPRLSAEDRRIEAEHPRLLEGVDRLIAQALDSDESVEKRVALGMAFDELRRHLESHEAAENTLLRQAFGTNFNGDEYPQPTLIQDA